MLRRVFIARWYLASLLIVGITGCGGPEVPTASVSGTVTINGKPVQGVQVMFVPDAKIRPSIGMTDAKGKYKAEFLTTQSGVALGSCVAQFSIFRGESLKNYLPKKFNDDAAGNPDFHLDVTKGGIKFDYDIKHDGEIPPYSPVK